MNITELTRKLIDIPSVTGDEQQIGRFIGSRLDDLGYKVEFQQVTRDHRANIIATTGLAPPRVVLSTHIDTVPPHIASSEDAEYIYGRGACDAKGIIAAQISAAERLREGGVAEVGLLFTVDEEIGSLGAQAANSLPVASECRYLINGEPTDNQLAIGSKGALRARISTAGRAAHSAYPEQGDSAIEKLLDVLARVRTCQWPHDEFFGETTCNIGTIHGGTRPNVIPAEAAAELLIRLAADRASVQEKLAQIIARQAGIEYLSFTDPVRMLAVEGFPQCVVRFTTDVPHLSKWGRPLLIGPGSILVAHTTEERIAKRELTEAVDLYVRLVHGLLAGEKTNATHRAMQQQQRG